MNDSNDGGKAPMTPEQVKANVDAMGADVDRVLAGEIPADSPAGYVRPDGVETLNESGQPFWFPPGFKAFEVTVDGEPLEES